MPDTSFVDRVRALGVTDDLLDEGLAELAAVVEGCSAGDHASVTVEANLRIARGLDYYTGTVVEIFMAGYERLKSVGGGGRYDALASDGRTTYPGVGVSFGVSRTLVPLVADGVLSGSRSVPERRARRGHRRGVSRAGRRRSPAALRARGIPCEVAPSAAKFGKQIRHADRRGIPYVWFATTDAEGATVHEVKDIRSGNQVPADPATWEPPAEDLRPTIISQRHQRGDRPVIRTHDAGALRAEHVGQTVTLAGWVANRRDHGGVAFIDLRDASGVVQVVIRDETVAHALRAEYCLKVIGEVTARKEGNENPNLPTGEVEVVASRRAAWRCSRPRRRLPFPISDHVDVGEEVRLKHRYLDLRRTAPGAALRLRSKVNQAARAVLDAHDFVEIETPTLTRSTPEGARDFLVPARLQPGSWYALPQSPQLFKQLLMVAGMERYYQIARCYRDEDFRADRQPEFTQLDVEMSFVEQDDVLALSEEILAALWQLIGYDVPLPIPRITFADAMARYGSDKPDLRMGQELVECTDYFKDTPFRVFQAPLRRRRGDARRRQPAAQAARRLAGVGQAARRPRPGLRPGPGGRRARRPGRQEPLRRGEGRPRRARRRPARRLRLLRRRARSSRAARCSVRPGSRSVAAAASSTRAPGASSGSSTPRCSSPRRTPPPPVTSRSARASGPRSTTPSPARRTPTPSTRTRATPLAWAYDIVCNGNEIGGGSIRIHREDVQKRVFALMGIGEEEAEEKFGFLLQAFKYGAPPHGGIAFGWDRICALLAGTDSIREVIAFPKSGGGFDPLTAAPAPITPEQRKEAGVDAVPEEDVRADA